MSTAKKTGEEATVGKTASQPKEQPRQPTTYNDFGLTDADFETGQWTGKLYKDPKRLTITEKEICFHNLDKNGRPTSVVDARVFEYLIHTQHIIVCGGVPYIYRGGCYRMDLRGVYIKSLIMECLVEAFVRSTTIERIYKLFLIRQELVIRPDQLNHHAGWFINFKNGMYNVKERTMRNHDPSIYSINQIPWDYSPDMDHGSGTEIEKFLTYSVPDKDDREMLLEYMGLCCSIDKDQQKMMVICGDGGTGKSTMINLIQKIVGKENISNVAMSKLSENFQAICLMGKLLNSCADLEIDALDDVTMIKKLIGEDAISDAYKGKDVISFDSYAKMLFSTNELPLVRNEKTEGFYRRLLILTMNEKPKKRDPRLQDKLEKEIPYLIHIAMEALHRMYTENKDGKIFESDKSKYGVSQLRRDSDTIEAFMYDMCDVGEADYKTSRKDLYEAYTKYCKDAECQSHQKKNFFKALRNKGFPECTVGGSRMFRLIKLKSVTADGFMTVNEATEDDIPFT